MGSKVYPSIVLLGLQLVAAPAIASIPSIPSIPSEDRTAVSPPESTPATPVSQLQDIDPLS